MLKEISLRGTTIKYDFQYKNVKNINLRIRSDGRVFVSANRWVPVCAVEDFLILKTDFILKAVRSYEDRAGTPAKLYFAHDEIEGVILGMCRDIYPYFYSRGVDFPDIRFRKMVSQWGSCHSTRGVITFNTSLAYTPKECVEYVVAHEFTHFLQPNHSADFYDELSRVMPDWELRKQKLKEISIR